MSAPLQFVAKGSQQLERRLEVGPEGRLAFHPRLRVGERLEDSTSSPCRAVHNASVDQKQEEARSLV